jgi:hypothetical protein
MRPFVSHRKHSPGDAVASSRTPSGVAGGASRAFVPSQGPAGPSFPPQVVHIDDPQRAELRLKQGLPPTDFV